MLLAAAFFDGLAALSASADAPATRHDQFVRLGTCLWRVWNGVQMLVWTQAIVLAHWPDRANCVTLVAPTDQRSQLGYGIDTFDIRVDFLGVFKHIAPTNKPMHPSRRWGRLK